MNQFIFAKNGLIYRYWFWLWTSIWQRHRLDLPNQTSLCAVCQFIFWGTFALIVWGFISLPFMLVGLLWSAEYRWKTSHLADAWQERAYNGVVTLSFILAIGGLSLIAHSGITKFWDIGWWIFILFGCLGNAITLFAEIMYKYGTSIEIWSYIIAGGAAAYGMLNAGLWAVTKAVRGSRWLRLKIRGSSVFTRTIDGLFGSDRVIEGHSVEVLGILPTILEYIKAMKTKVCPIVRFVDLDDYVDGAATQEHRQ